MSTDERKADTRQKIELGGLIVKAGLREEDRAAIYGGLLELRAKLEDPNEFARLQRFGERMFRNPE